MCPIGGAQNAEALFRQTQPGAQQASRQAVQQDSSAFPSRETRATPQNPAVMEHVPSLGPKSVQGRMLTFASAGGKGVLSSSVPASFPSAAGMLTLTANQAGASFVPTFECIKGCTICNAAYMPSACAPSPIAQTGPFARKMMPIAHTCYLVAPGQTCCINCRDWEEAVCIFCWHSSASLQRLILRIKPLSGTAQHPARRAAAAARGSASPEQHSQCCASGPSGCVSSH